MNKSILVLIPILFCYTGIFCQKITNIILDTDMASDCDDVGALLVLNALVDINEASILAVVTNTKDGSNSSAMAVDAINSFFGRPDIPIGTDKDGPKVGQRGHSSFTAILKNEFPNDIGPDDEAQDALGIYRKVLAEQPDSSVIVCSVGALSNLEDLLISQSDEYSNLSGRELIAKKVKRTIIMGGGFPRSMKRETNIYLDPIAAIKVTNEWPGEIIWQGFEIGLRIVTGTEFEGISYKHPGKRAYSVRPFMGYNAIDFGKPSHDQVAVLLAVRGVTSDCWKISETGKVSIDSAGNTEFIQSKNGKQRYVILTCPPRIIEREIGELMTFQPRNR